WGSVEDLGVGRGVSVVVGGELAQGVSVSYHVVGSWTWTNGLTWTEILLCDMASQVAEVHPRRRNGRTQQGGAHHETGNVSLRHGACLRDEPAEQLQHGSDHHYRTERPD